MQVGAELQASDHSEGSEDSAAALKRSARSFLDANTTSSSASTISILLIVVSNDPCRKGQLSPERPAKPPSEGQELTIHPSHVLNIPPTDDAWKPYHDKPDHAILLVGLTSRSLEMLGSTTATPLSTSTSMTLFTPLVSRNFPPIELSPACRACRGMIYFIALLAIMKVSESSSDSVDTLLVFLCRAGNNLFTLEPQASRPLERSTVGRGRSE